MKKVFNIAKLSNSSAHKATISPTQAKNNETKNRKNTYNKQEYMLTSINILNTMNIKEERTADLKMLPNKNPKTISIQERGEINNSCMQLINFPKNNELELSS